MSEKKLDGSRELWKKVAYDYAEGLNSVSVVELDCGHYIFHYEPEKITEEIHIGKKSGGWRFLILVTKLIFLRLTHE